MSLYFHFINALDKTDAIDGTYFPQFQLLARARDPDNEDNLAMRTADPLWMLGRQWQFGEFIGEDNGSPISIKGNYYKRRANYYEADGEKVHLHNHPLEVKVEAIAIDQKDLRTKVKIGQRFERMIRQRFDQEGVAYIQKLRETFPLRSEEKLDETSKRFLRLMRNKSIDGEDLLAAIKNNGLGRLGLAILNELGIELKTWFESFYAQPDPSINTWDAEQLLHRFAIGTQDGKVKLSAPDYQSGHLDWYSFDSAEIGLLESAIRNSGQDMPAYLPVNMSFPAMPDKRLFAFEDNRINLGDMDIQDDDLIRMMMLNFSLASGSDWYTIPMVMEVGEICWINHVEVLDVFGVKTTIRNSDNVGPSFPELKNGRPASLDTWDVFKIRTEPQARYHHKEHFLYLAPVLPKRQESPPVEEVLLLRDEFANMAWAIEKRLRNPLGKTVEGFEFHLERYGPFLDLGTAKGKDKNSYPKYRLATTVPTNWIPYLPRLNGSSNDMKLHQAVLPSNEPDKKNNDFYALSHLAAEITVLREETLPSSGLRLQITKQRVRWTNGETFIWLGRKVLPGKGEGDSGLRFDVLQ